MPGKILIAVVASLVIITFAFLRALPEIGGSSPPSEFLEQEVIIADFLSLSPMAITVRELENFYRNRRSLSVAWEKMDQRRFILRTSTQDPLTGQTTLLAWQFLSVKSEQEIPVIAQGRNVLGAYVERLAVNGEIAPMAVIQMAMFGILPEIARIRALQKK